MCSCCTLWGLADMLHVMHTFPGPWLAPSHSARFYHAGRVALMSFAKLSITAKTQCIARWPAKPKAHLLDRLIDLVLATNLHPGFTWAFADEDFNGKMMRMACNLAHPSRFLKGLWRSML